MAFQMIFVYQEIRTNFTLVCDHVICHDSFIKFFVDHICRPYVPPGAGRLDDDIVKINDSSIYSA